MWMVLLAALSVGGATVAGSLIGLCFQHLPPGAGNRMLHFSAGMMLCAAVVSLILPSAESGTLPDLLLAVLGVMSGGILLGLAGNALPHSPDMNRAMLLVLAIALHNAPEGLAAGVSFGCASLSDTLLILGGIMLQNIPEGLIIIPPMLSAGFSRRKAFFYALGTGLIEVLGTFLGYFCISLSTAMLPFLLSFAGGAMLFVVCGEMMPKEQDKPGLYILLAGVCLIFLANGLLS